MMVMLPSLRFYLQAITTTAAQEHKILSGVVLYFLALYSGFLFADACCDPAR